MPERLPGYLTHSAYSELDSEWKHTLAIHLVIVATAHIYWILFSYCYSPSHAHTITD